MLTPTQLIRRRLNMQLPHPVTAMVILMAIFAFFLIVTPAVTTFLSKFITREVAALRMAMVIQDVFVFILPPIVTAIVATRLPARLLAIDIKPKIEPVLLSLLVLICSIPAMNLIVEWNQQWHLPESMSTLEHTFRRMEESAQGVTDMLMSGASIPSLIVSILIVGCLAGLGEELFFRGAMQRIMMMARNMNPHVAIWITAFIFSLFHFQIFGFVPRMLLGAFFGYLLWWTGSLWVPVILHTCNNSIVVTATWLQSNHHIGSEIDKIGTAIDSPAHTAAVVMSIIICSALIILLRQHTLACTKSKKD